MSIIWFFAGLNLSGRAVMRVILLVIFVVFPLCTVVAPDKDAWPVTNFTETIGHYPSSYCHFSDVVFSPAEKAFLYRSDVGHHVDCHGIVDIWPIRNVSDISLNCDEEYDNGHVFTIYYWYGGSNYFHLHYDMLIPLYSAVHHNQEPDGYQNKHVFMPTVESRRLSVSISCVQSCFWHIPVTIIYLVNQEYCV